MKCKRNEAGRRETLARVTGPGGKKPSAEGGVPMVTANLAVCSLPPSLAEVDL